jgi:Predicted exporters of the RND superfamily
MYKNIISFPKIIILVISIIVLSSLYFAKDFKLDASADTLLLENDPDLKYLREINKRYGSEDFFILTYEPKGPTDKNSILELEQFTKKLMNYRGLVKL